MRIRPSIACAIGFVAIALGMSSCGGDSSSSPTQPSVPVTTVIAQGSGSVSRPGCTCTIENGWLTCTCPGYTSETLPSFTTTATGRIEFVLDWTFSSNDLDAYLYQGSTLAGNTSSSSTKPEHLQLENMPAGTYTPKVRNYGPADESYSYQILFTR